MWGRSVWREDDLFGRALDFPTAIQSRSGVIALDLFPSEDLGAEREWRWWVADLSHGFNWPDLGWGWPGWGDPHWRLASGGETVASLWLPYWILVFALAILPLLWLWRRRRRMALERVGCCATCGYNLTGNVSGICPECGKAISAGRGPAAAGYKPAPRRGVSG